MAKKYLAFKEDVTPLAELLAEAFVKSGSGDTLTWDGDTTGLTVVDMGTVDSDTSVTKTLAYHVSNAVLTPADIANGFTITIKHIEDSVEQVLSFPAGDENVGIEQLTDKLVLVKVADQNIVLIVSEDNYELDGITFKKGIYYCVVTKTRVSGASETMYPISAKINGYTGFVSTTLNEECLPEIVKNAFVESDPVVSSDTITWDGKTDGLEAVSVNDRTQAYHVSDAVPTLADIEGRITLITTLTSDNEKQSLTSDLLQVKQLTEKFIGISESGMYHVFVCSEDNYEIDDLVFPKKGIYLCTIVSAVDSNDLIYTSSVTISGYKGFTTTTTAVKLNYDYLPDVVKNAFVESNSGGSDTLTWDGKTDGLLSVELAEGIKAYHISDETPTEAEMTGNISMAGKRDTYTDGVLTGSEESAAADFQIMTQDKLSVVIGINVSVSPVAIYTIYVCAEDNYTMTNEDDLSLTFPKKGIYVIVGQDVNDDGATIIDYPTSITINGYTGFVGKTTVKLNEDYLPYIVKNAFVVAESAADTLTWDGNTDGMEGIVLGENTYYHVSDVVPTDEELSNGTTVKSTSLPTPVSVTFMEPSGSFKMDVLGCVIICSDEVDSAFPKKGIYFLSTADRRTEYFTINGYAGFGCETTVKLNEEYLPDSLTGDLLVETTKDTLAWNGKTSGLTYVTLGTGEEVRRFYHISDAVPTDAELSSGATAEVLSSKTKEVVTGDVTFESDDESIKVGLLNGSTPVVIICSKDNHTYDGITFHKKGIYFAWVEVVGTSAYYYTKSLTINGYTGFEHVKKLNEKYIPDMTAEQVGLDWVTRPNLLANADFTGYVVNQREFTTLVMDDPEKEYGVFVADRWKVYRGIVDNTNIEESNGKMMALATVTLDEDGITLSTHDVGENEVNASWIFQTLPYAKEGVYTISVNIDGNVYSYTFDTSEIQGGTTFAYQLSYKNFIGVNYYMGYLSVVVGIFNSTSKDNVTSNIKWVKLEEGSVATPLETKKAKDIWQELSICERFYRAVSPCGATITSIGADYIVALIPIPTVMVYKNPTIDASGVKVSYCPNKDSSVEIQGTTIKSASANTWANKLYLKIGIPSGIEISLDKNFTLDGFVALDSEIF